VWQLLLKLLGLILATLVLMLEVLGVGGPGG
jgi:hypothetical protein